MNPAKNMITGKVDSLWVNVHLATMTEIGPYGMMKDGAIAIRGGKIAYIGKRIDLPTDFESRTVKVYDGQSGWITPGFVDRIGTLEQGRDADFVIWDIAKPAELAYRIGFIPLEQVVLKGKLRPQLS